MPIALSKQPNKMPPALPGFEKINRYWDKQSLRFVAKIIPGEYYVTIQEELITTVLGSCISACIRCRLFGVGGMNHFMLPNNPNVANDNWDNTAVNGAARYGSFAMEQMINDILRHGGSRKHIEVKIAGGGQVLGQNSNIGNRNIDFVMEYIRTEKLNLAGEDVGDVYPRKVMYDPKSGQMWVKKIRKLEKNTIMEREQRYQHQLAEQPVGGDVELF